MATSPESSIHPDDRHDARVAGGLPADGVSPEIALVSPELAEQARRELPDRPWDLPDGRAHALIADQPPPHDGGSRPETVSRARVVLAGAAACLVLGVLVVGARMDFRRESSNAGAPQEVSGTETPPISLVGRAGYVVSPAGSFMTSASGRTIESFTLPLRCGSRQLVIENVPVGGSSFRYSGEAVGQPVVVRLRARLLNAERIRGVVAAEGAACSSGSVEFTARLS